jgi:hypothetical protein
MFNFFCVKDIKYISMLVFFSVSTMLIRGVQNSEIATVGQEFGKMRRATSCDWQITFGHSYLPFANFAPCADSL